MNIFDHPNMFNFKCPICGTNEDKPVTLIPIEGTREGNKSEVKQVHVECLDLTFVRGNKDGLTTWIVQTLEPEL